MFNIEVRLARQARVTTLQSIARHYVQVSRSHSTPKESEDNASTGEKSPSPKNGNRSGRAKLKPNPKSKTFVRRLTPSNPSSLVSSRSLPQPPSAGASTVPSRLVRRSKIKAKSSTIVRKTGTEHNIKARSRKVWTARKDTSSPTPGIRISYSGRGKGGPVDSDKVAETTELAVPNSLPNSAPAKADESGTEPNPSNGGIKLRYRLRPGTEPPISSVKQKPRIERPRGHVTIRKHRVSTPRIRTYPIGGSQDQPQIRKLLIAHGEETFHSHRARPRLSMRNRGSTDLGDTPRVLLPREELPSFMGTDDAPKKKVSRKNAKAGSNQDVAVITREGFQLTHIDIGSSDAPGLAHGLDRVLFNPGVYYLQDPRSRVYNFDPYLQKIMPAKEFNYGALTKYIVPSKDMTLAHLAKERNLRYYSSSSNMTSILEHLHFLLSQWRELNFSMLSKKFETTSKKFSKFSRGPTTVFLRWKNGVYAVDKSKDGQTPNIFGLLGHSLEKLLVLPADDYETYRRTSPALSKGVDEVPEGYHFSSSDKILLRSQLDAKDPRMPGTGVFDLKTRAVLSLRHAPSEKFEDYLGYELRQSQGNWMSYEREFHDMMRATMLKYSLQVRIGRMDGIFVAYHNVERLFGFQYVSLAEMDEAIHGQQDPSLGDQEFGMSLKVVDDIFDKATARFPEQSIRLSFETREGVVPFMYAFAEPVSETEIEEIQGASDQRQREYEASLFGEDVDSEKSIDENEWAKIRDSIEDALEQEQGSDEVTEEPTVSDEAPNDVLEEDVHQVAPNAKRGKKTSSPEQQAETPLLGFTVTVRNLVNGFQVDRPVDLAPEDSWKVEYAITELKESSARRYYALLTARRQALTRGSVDRQEDRFWFRHIRHYVEESKKWRRAQDRIDDRKGTVVFRPTHPNVSAHTLQELGKAREDSVDSYMAWLYGEKS